MLNRSSLARLIVLAALLIVVVGAATAQAAPTAARVRVAHLAPFPGSNNATISVQIAAAPIGGNLAYSDRTNYVTVAGGAGTYNATVLHNGGVIYSEAITLTDGDSSLIVVGDQTQVPLDILLVDDALADPGPGAGGLRFVHVAALGATIDETRVDVCFQDGDPFHNTSTSFRYLRTTAYRILPAGPYDMKVSRYSETTPCAGEVIINPPPLPVGVGARRTVYLVGDGTNQDLAMFTFGEGIIASEGDERLFLPAIRRQ